MKKLTLALLISISCKAVNNNDRLNEGLGYHIYEGTNKNKSIIITDKKCNNLVKNKIRKRKLSQTQLA